MPKLRLAAKVLAALFFIAYPFAIYFGLQQFSVKTVALLVLLVAALRTWAQRQEHGDTHNGSLLERWGVLAIGLLVGGSVFLLDDEIYLRFYPVLMNVLFLFIFAGTLRFPPSMIERFARMQEPELTAAGVAYTRRVTQLWCAFFVLNAAVACYTALISSLEIWTLYNGFVAYLLIGLLFAGEWVYRWWTNPNERQE